MTGSQSSSRAALSISIVTYRVDPEVFRRVLQSLDRALARLQAAEAATVAIKIIDNGDQEALLEGLVASFRREAIDYEIIGGLDNIGYGRAHNLAILTTRAPYHLILNPDVELDQHCLLHGLHYLRASQGVSAVAPFAVDGEGRVQYLCKRFPNVLDLVLRGFAPTGLKRLFHRRLARYELRDLISDRAAVEGVPLISGCYMLCDARLLKQAGGFNERFFLYFEDYALSMELRKFGALAYLPDMRIRHYGGNSARKGLRHILMFAHSGIKFFNTYGWKII